MKRLQIQGQRGRTDRNIIIIILLFISLLVYLDSSPAPDLDFGDLHVNPEI